MTFKVTKNNRSIFSFVFCITFLWSIYACTYSILKYTPTKFFLSGYLSLIGEVGLDIFLTLLLFSLWYKTNFSNNKKLFLLFFLSLLSAVFADGVYNFVLNLYGFKYVNPIVICMFELPFLLFLLFQALAWSYILYINKENLLKFNISPYLPYLIVSTLMFLMFIFGVTWEIQYFSIKGIFQIIDTVLEVIGFSIATLCLARAQNFLVRFTSIGYLLIVASDFIIRYHVISGKVPYLSSLESTWVLGLILMSMGFFLIKNSCDESLFKLFMIYSLQSQIAIWLLILWLISVFMFAGACYFFSPNNDYYLSHIAQNFLSMLVPFSLLAIISSNYIAAKISSPLSKLEGKINEFLLTDVHQQEFPNLADYRYISEFKALEDFILGSFILYQKKHIADITFAKIATQVSHDIRSPLATINTVLAITKVPENRRLLIKNAANRINEIANSLLMSSKNKLSDISAKRLTIEKEENDDDGITTELIFVVLDNIVAEKRYEYYQSKIDIQLQADEKSYNCFSKINLTSFSRVLSNLINNSVESLNGEGSVLISLAASSDYIEISIKDNGCGIPAHLIEQITAEGFSFNKKNGAGFGLFYAQKYIEQIEGSMLIKSKENIGTEVLIRLVRY